MDLFPIFLKIAARHCMVIGAGNLAESKIESLQAAHARVTVIAPEARPRIAYLAAAGEVEWLEREYPNACLIRNERNLGFAVAVNQGIRATASAWVALLNNDAIPAPDWVDPFLHR